MIEQLSLFIVIAISFVLSLFIYAKNPKSATNIAYSFFAGSLAFWSAVMYLSLNPPQADQTLFFVRVSMLSAIVMSYAALILSHTIPSNKLRLDKSILIVISILSLLGMTTAMSPYMFTHLEVVGQNIEPIAGPGMLMFMITGLGYTLASLVILAKRYSESSGIVKKQLRFVLIGMAIMFFLLITGNFIIVLAFGSSALISYGPVFTLPFLLLTAFAIIKHRLLDINILVARTVSFTLLTLIISIIYTTLIFALSALIPSNQQFISHVLFAIIIAFTFNPIRRRVELLTTNIFHKQPYSSENLLETLGKITRSSLSMDSLTRRVLNELSDTMHITHAAFFINSDEGYTTRSTGYEHTPSYSDNTFHNLEQAAKQDMVIFDELEEGATKMLLRQHDISILIPLRVKSTSHGLFVLGEKASGEIFNQQDIDVLEIFAPQISIAIQNALSYEEIKNFNITLKEEVDQATKKLKKANKHLKHLDKLKNEFIFIATHELKNPVTAIRGYTSMLEEGVFGKIPKKMQEPVDQLQSSTQQLVELINDLLQIARSEAKTLTIDPEKVDLCPAIDAVVGNVKSLIDQKGLKLVHTCPSPKKFEVKADPIRLKEIINNLVSNAIKYSEKGTIEISHELKDDMVLTHVKDQGVGIPKEDQDKIFTRFFRVEEQAAKGIPGTGLGLYIIKQIIEKMGGKIWFDSEADKGTTFTFSLPKA